MNTHARERLAGALALLGDLRAELALRRDEANSEPSRETLDEVLGLLASLESEYRRRYEATPPAAGEHASHVFLLDAEGGVHPLPHSLYVELARGAAAAPEFAGRAMRLADWYVRLAAGAPVAIINETYATVTFDPDGRMHLAKSPTEAPTAWLPSRTERAAMRALVFGAE
jgi:hypothetical protein